MVIPIAGVSQFILGLVLLIAWVFIQQHRKRGNAPAIKSVAYFESYFIHFACFNFILAAPHLVLFFAPETFPVVMGIGYTVAHLFVFIALGYLSRMTVSLIPRIARFEKAVFVFWLAFGAVVGVLNTLFATLQNQPTFNFATGLTEFHIPDFIGIIFGNASLLAYVPLIVLFTISVFKNRGPKRTRALLFAFGMLIIMVAGPLHAVARDWQTYVSADLFNVIGVVLVAIGIIIQIDEGFSAKASNEVIQPSRSVE